MKMKATSYLTEKDNNKQLILKMSLLLVTGNLSPDTNTNSNSHRPFPSQWFCAQFGPI